MLHETYCSSVLKNDRYLLNEVIDHLLQLNCNQILIGIDATGKIFFSNSIAVNNLKIKSNNNLTEILPSIVPYLGEVINKLVCYFDLPIQINKFEFLAKLSPIILKNICMGVFCVFESSIKGFRYNQSIKSYCNLNPEADIIFNNSYDGLWILDGNGKILAINPAAERLNKIEAEDCIGKNIIEIMSENFIDPSIFPEVMRKRTVINRIQRNKIGRKLLVTAVPLFDEKKKIIRIVTNERDITELEDLKRQIEEKEELKNKYENHLRVLQMDEIKYGNIIAKSPNIINIFQQAIKLSEVNTTVLITGESGVGKGVITKFIHNNSIRKYGPMIDINCSTIPESLLEMEIFGYVRGAFTGADAKGKPGYFELANKGTLFLDEIGELSLSSQVKLLRFIEDGTIKRIGGNKNIQIDVRILAATNANLEELVKNKKFRLDLYHRLNVISLKLPPLRKRRDCILPLINHYVCYFSEKMERKEKPRISSRAQKSLLNYDYPGNVRELINICERLIVMTDSNVIGVNDLSISTVEQKDGVHTEQEQNDSILPLIELIQIEERKILINTMRKYKTQSKAAKALCVTQPTIARKLKKYGISQKYRIMQ